MISKNLQSYKDVFQEYTELRVQENRHIGIDLVNGDVMANQKHVHRGVSARVYTQGMWGFASHPALADETIRQVIREATANAAFLNTREQRQAKALPKAGPVQRHEFITKGSALVQKDLIDFLRSIDTYLTDHYKRLHSRTIGFRAIEMEKSLLTSEGASFYSHVPQTFLYLVLSIEKNGKSIDLHNTYGGFGTFGDHFCNLDTLCRQFDEQYTHLMHKIEGVYAEAGIADCVLDANLAGILAHEAIGHTTEADLVMGGSVAGDYLGQQVANPLVTLSDFAHTAFEQLCPVPVFIDDEGTKAEDVTLIEQGVLKGFLHNKESAGYFQTDPTGNARAFQFSDEPLIRMRNTAIWPGADTLADMIASVDQGYYFVRSSNGQADSTSEFMFGIVMGYEIKNGRLGKALLDTTISGMAFDVLKSVSMISNEMVWSKGGLCGKKQLIPVGMGGPAIKCRVNVGGK